MSQVVEASKEQQSKAEQLLYVSKILGDVKHSYMENMESLASAIDQKVSYIQWSSPKSSEIDSDINKHEHLFSVRIA